MPQNNRPFLSIEDLVAAALDHDYVSNNRRLVRFDLNQIRVAIRARFVTKPMLSKIFGILEEKQYIIMRPSDLAEIIPSEFEDVYVMMKRPPMMVASTIMFGPDDLDRAELRLLGEVELADGSRIKHGKVKRVPANGDWIKYRDKKGAIHDVLVVDVRRDGSSKHFAYTVLARVGKAGKIDSIDITADSVVELGRSSFEGK